MTSSPKKVRAEKSIMRPAGRLLPLQHSARKSRARGRVPHPRRGAADRSQHREIARPIAEAHLHRPGLLPIKPGGPSRERTLRRSRAGRSIRLKSHWKDNCAHQPFRAPVEAKVAFVLVSDHAFHHASTEALACGLVDRRTALLGPSEDELVA